MFGIMFTNREIKVSSIVPFKTSPNFGVDWELKFEPRLPLEVLYQHSSCLLDILDDQERRPEPLQLGGRLCNCRPIVSPFRNLN